MDDTIHNTETPNGDIKHHLSIESLFEVCSHQVLGAIPRGVRAPRGSKMSQGGLVVVVLHMSPQQGLLAAAAIEAWHQRRPVQLDLGLGQFLLLRPPNDSELYHVISQYVPTIIPLLTHS